MKAAYPAFAKSLADSFFKVRYDRATLKEKEFMLVMGECDETIRLELFSNGAGGLQQKYILV